MPFSRPPFTGFPFDSDDAHFRSELEDIAHRHPEFAEHLNPAAHSRRANADRFRSPDPFADYRSPSGRQWPFSSRFQQFPFPFTSDFDEDPLTQQRQYQSQAANERPPEKQEEKVNEKPPQAPQKPAEERSRRNIQQSNTVDLGQRQETVDDNSRNQRSMSAPPENRNTSSKRFVSSINIPNLSQPTGDSSMGGRMSQPETPPQQQQQQPQNKPTERIIPIHIEGRDVPIIPKNVNISGAAPQPERIFTGGRQMPEPERIFGQRPSTFTQFVNKDPDVERQREEQAKQQQEYQRQQQEYQKQQQQEYQKQQQQQEFQKQQQQEAQKPTPPPEQKPTPLDLILNIQKDVSKLMEDVAKFEGKPKDKQYLYLDEMLTRNMLKLDNIETEGKDAIRQARKEAIKCIEQCIQVLESKALANQANKEEKMEVEPEQKPAEGEPKTEAMQVETEPPKEEAKPENKEEKPAAEEAKKEEGGDEKNKPAADEKKEEDDTNAPAAVKVEEPAAEDKKEEVKEEKSEPSHEESKPEEKEKDKKKGKKKSESK